MKKILLLLVLLICGLFLIGCSSIPKEKQCNVDNDCVQNACCHASEAVNKEFGPNCRGQLCTLDCQDGTTDCGQGSVKCVSGECKVVMN